MGTANDGSQPSVLEAETVQDAPIANAAPDFLSGGGEMGALIRSLDWSNTAIGVPETWSPALRTMVHILLANRFPQLLWWGPDYIQIYNDAYQPIPGAKHPKSLGQPGNECWSEVWNILGPLVDTPFHGGPATWIEDLELELRRAGFSEETHFTVAYSPVLDETAPTGIGGVLATVHEITDKIVGERRINVLRDLGTRAADAKTAEEACIVAAKALARHPKDIPFALLYVADPEGKQAHLAASSGLGEASAIAPPVIDLSEAGSRGSTAWPLAAARQTEQLQLIENLSSAFGTVPPGPWSDPPHTAVVAPIRSNIEHHFSGFLVAGLSSRLKFNDGYRNFLELATAQIATAIANARAYEQERKRAEALAEVDRAKTVFFSNVSHEFRTPLTLMLAPLEEILAKDAGAASAGSVESETRSLLKVAHRNGLRLQKLVNTLLEFSRMEAGRMNASYEPTELAALTVDLASNFRSACDKAGLSLIIDCPPLPEPVFVDRDMWEKIVLNLVSNAFKYTFDGEIRISLRAQENRAVLTVADTGIGIPQHELPRIFERFHRIEGTRGRTQEGTGIGLALVHDLARLHGGSVQATSVLGQGSVFTVEVPLGRHPLAVSRPDGKARSSSAVGAASFVEEALRWLPEGTRAQQQAPAAERTGQTILVVEDNSDMRDYVARILRDAYHVIAVQDGRQALDVVSKHQPDLILSDVMMPNLDGFGLLAALRANPKTVATPVILLSARAGEEASSQGLAAGADDYLVKPFSARELISRVGAHLKLARARKQAEEQAEHILESITDGFLAFDREWRYTYVNGQAERLNGMSRKDMLGRSHWELFPATVGTIIDREFHRAVAENVPVEFDNHYAPWNRWFHIKAYPTAEGGLSVFYEDITKRRKADALLAAQNSVLHMLATGEPLADVLASLIRAIEEQTEGCMASILVRDQQSESFTLCVGPSLPEQFCSSLHGAPVAPPYHSPCSRAAHLGEIVISPEIGSDERWTAEWRDVVLSLGLRACYSAPIFATDGRVIGSVGVYYRDPQPALSPDASIIGSATHLAGIAIERRWTEHALRESETRYRSLAEQVSDGIFIADKNGRYLDSNRAGYEMLGYERSELLALSVTDMLAPNELARLPDQFERLATGRIVQSDWRFRRKDGSTFIGELASRQLPDGRFQGVVRDVTERRSAEEQLRKSEERFRFIAECAQVGYWDWDIVADRLDWSPVCKRLFGIPEEEEMSYARFLSAIHPEDRARTDEAVRRSLEDGAEYDIEYRCEWPDGSSRWVHAKGNAVIENEKALRMAGIALDITGRKRTEEALLQSEARLRDSEAQFRNLAEAIPQLCWMAYSDGHIFWYNRRWYEYTGTTFEQMQGWGWQVVHDPETLPAVMERWTVTIREGKPFEMVFPLRRADGTFRPFLTRVVPIRDAAGEVTRWFGTNTDISELKETEKELRSANAGLEQFAYAASHDLQEPVRSVKIYSQLLENRCASQLDEQALQFLKYLCDGATRMELLVRDLLSYTQAGRLDEGAEFTDAEACLQTALANLAGAIAETNARVTYDALPSVRVRATHLQQLFQNLIGNAIKYRQADRTAEVHVSAIRKNGSCQITVADNGIGINPSHKDQIFGLFKRLHTNEEYAGTGIGLAICLRIVERYGGRIWVDSKPGKGSNFRFTIPV